MIDKFMNKSDIILKVATNFYDGEMDEDEISLHVSAWDKKTGFMIDEHLTELFPELNSVPLYDLSEGVCECAPEVLKIEEVVQILRQKGFFAI
jgi:hypothetical protein